MADLLKEIAVQKPQYRDRRFPGDQDAWEQRLRESTTVYVGNLSFYTREEQVYEVFAKAGIIDCVIMGLHKEKRTPCGFCFVQYRTRADAEAAVSFIHLTKLDNRPIRVDVDWGFEEGRQYGRGKSGGQVRDEYRKQFDSGRGGLGVQAQYEAGMQGEQQRGPNKRARNAGAPGQDGPLRGPVPPSEPPPPIAPPPPPEEVDGDADMEVKADAGEEGASAGEGQEGEEPYMQTPGGDRATKRARLVEERDEEMAGEDTGAGEDDGLESHAIDVDEDGEH